MEKGIGDGRELQTVFLGEDCLRQRAHELEDSRGGGLVCNYKLSDDIAFRFSNRSWNEWPLTADKYVKWLASDETPGGGIKPFMDYERPRAIW